MKRLLRSWSAWAAVLLIIWLIVIVFSVPGCAGARITPAVNKAETTQTSSGPSERTLITIGKPTVEPKGAK